jgi:hypothetical protein
MRSFGTSCALESKILNGPETRLLNKYLYAIFWHWLFGHAGFVNRDLESRSCIFDFVVFFFKFLMLWSYYHSWVFFRSLGAHFILIDLRWCHIVVSSVRIIIQRDIGDTNLILSESWSSCAEVLQNIIKAVYTFKRGDLNFTKFVSYRVWKQVLKMWVSTHFQRYGQRHSGFLCAQSLSIFSNVLSPCLDSEICLKSYRSVRDEKSTFCAHDIVFRFFVYSK